MKLIAAACAAMLFAGCGKDDESGKKGGEPTSGNSWMLTSWNDSDALAGKVYLQLNDDRTFVLYQNVETPGFVELRGVYTSEQFAPGSGFILSGVYSDGKPWAERYWISYDKNTLTLKVHPDGVVSVYTAVDIPDYVKMNSAAKTARSADVKPFL